MLITEGAHGDAGASLRPADAAFWVAPGRRAARWEAALRQLSESREWRAAGGDRWIRTVGRLWNPLDEARRRFAGHGSLRLLCRDTTEGAPESRDRRPRRGP